MKQSRGLILKPPVQILLALTFMSAAFPQSNARITVCVNDDNTSSPIVGANLELFRQGISQGKTVTGGDGCAVFEVVVTGIDDRDDSPIRSFQLGPIYPNPSSHAINFEMSVPRAGILDYAVYDILGRTLASGSAQAQAGAQALNLDISALPNGKYFLQLENSAARKVVPFTKIGTSQGGPIRVSITPGLGISLERWLPKKLSFTASNEFMLVASAAGFKTSSLRFAVSQDTTVVFSLAAVAGASCDNLPAELSDINDFIVPNSVSVTQVVVGGIPRRQSELFITFVDDVEICNQDSFALDVMVRDPVDSLLKAFSVAIDTITVLGNQIRLLVNGPITTGSILAVGRGALGVGDNFMDRGSLILQGSGLLTSTAAAFWYKALEPNNFDFFQQHIYPGSAPPIPYDQPTDSSIIYEELAQHFENFLNLGMLDSARVQALLNRYLAAVNGTDAATREVFTDDNGNFYPYLLASVLANAGTITEDVIEVLIDGDNLTRRPAKVIYGRLQLPDFTAQVTFRNNRMIVTVSEDKGLEEPLQMLASLLGHEGFHQDRPDGKDEEVIASVAGTLSYTQQIYANPDFAKKRMITPLMKAELTRVMAMINSGQNYPKPGVLDAPLIQPELDVFPGSADLRRRSFDWILRNRTYAGIPNIPTEGNNYLDTVVSKITGTTHSGLRYNSSTVRLVDHATILSLDYWFEIARMLELKLPNIQESKQISNRLTDAYKN